MDEEKLPCIKLPTVLWQFDYKGCKIKIDFRCGRERKPWKTALKMGLKLAKQIVVITHFKLAKNSFKIILKSLKKSPKILHESTVGHFSKISLIFPAFFGSLKKWKRSQNGPKRSQNDQKGIRKVSQNWYNRSKICPMKPPKNA